MRSFSRRTFLASSVVLGLGAAAPVGAAKPDSKNDTTVRLKVTDAIADAGICYLPREAVTALGIGDGQQARLLYGGEPAVFTVHGHDDKFGAVNPDGRNRLGATKNSLRVETESEVVHPTISRERAAETGEFIERYVSGSTATIALAPHGGYIEYGTDHQAMRFADRLDATAWYCSGWWPGGGAYRRWHVTSTYIDPESFPALGEIRNTGFDTAVSFHGWSEPFLSVGGTAPLSLREAVRDSIEAVVNGAFEVRLATDPARDGTSPDNLVNWITASGEDGVQIEQPLTARRTYGDAIADATAEVIAR